MSRRADLAPSAEGSRSETLSSASGRGVPSRVEASLRVVSTTLRREGGGGDRPSSPGGRPPQPSRPPPPSSEDSVGPRERFAAGLLLPLAIAAVFGNAVGGLLAKGITGVGGDGVVERWRILGIVTPGTAALLGLGTTIALVMAAVGNPRTSISTRLVATFGAGLVLTFVAASLRDALLMTHLIVLFAGSFAVLVAGGVEAVTPPATRALGVLLAMLALSATLRVGAWGLAWSAANRGHLGALPWSRAAVGVALVIELIAQLFVVVYLVYRPGWRGVVVAIVAVVLAYVVSVWALKTSYVAGDPGKVRDALQRALSFRVQMSGPIPSWVDPLAAQREIAMLDKNMTTGLLPLVFGELGSITIAIAALASASRQSAPLLAAMALAVLSRGQVDQPLRALELCVAALAALVLSRSRVRAAA